MNPALHSGQDPYDRVRYPGDDDPRVLEQIEACQVIGSALLVELGEFLGKHRIPFFLDAGTLLGAYRHKGWIPWDDDVDIAMFRSDYERLREIRDKLPSYLDLSDCELNPEHVTQVPRINYLPSGLRWVEPFGVTPPERQRIVVDIYLIDGDLSPNTRRRLWLLATRGLQLAIAIRGTTLRRIWRTAPSLLLALPASALYLIALVIPRKFLVRSYVALAKRGKDSSQNVVFLNHNGRVRSRPYPRTAFEGDSTRVEFEGASYASPEPETFLSIHYGDSFQDLPPLQDRRPHTYDQFWAIFGDKSWGEVPVGQVSVFPVTQQQPLQGQPSGDPR